MDALLARFRDARVRAAIERILDRADLNALSAYYAARGLDPAIHFYEELTRACDPATARKRGVHYSPPAVVAYIVRGVESILRSQFGRTLSDAVLLDPCCGIGTFLRYVRQYAAPCPRLIGMELLPAAHDIASALLPGSEILLADGLDDHAIDTAGAPLVVLGNPPYSGHSANAGAVSQLLKDYSSGLNERNPKWLQDDYVKFIRVAQRRVEEAGRGLVAFITNHSFIFSPTFRAMRLSLMDTFDQVRILDLNGNSRRAKQTDGDEPDENVFPIQTGVAISFMVRSSGSPGCEISHAALFGTRESKLKRLSEMGFHETPWRRIVPDTRFSLFIPHRADLHAEYAEFMSLFDIFRQSSVGFVTSRDAFAVDVDREALLERIALLRDADVPAEELRERLPIGDLDIEAARQVLRNDPHWRDKAVEVLYRPFDRRWAYMSPAVMERPRLPFMESLLHPNVALAIGRAGHVTGSSEWDVVFCTDRPTDLNLFRRGGAVLLPRYVYPGGVRRSNMVCRQCDEDQLFHYIYAILHSTTYRLRYADLLMIDFPRIPPPRDDAQLRSMAALGRELVQVHLMTEEKWATKSNDQSSLRIGGYELPHKMLRDRRLRGLFIADPMLAGRIAAAVSRTIEIRRAIDELVAAGAPWADRTR